MFDSAQRSLMMIIETVANICFLLTNSNPVEYHLTDIICLLRYQMKISLYLIIILEPINPSLCTSTLSQDENFGSLAIKLTKICS